MQQAAAKQDAAKVYNAGLNLLARREHSSKELKQKLGRRFADALVDVPLALAENSGLDPVLTVSAVQAQQQADSNPYLGVDCMSRGTNDMKAQKVFETLKGKQQQLLLATQVVKMILKIDDVIKPSQYE